MRSSWLMPLALCALITGCEPKRTTITGRVLLNGKPVLGGRLTFRPDDSSQLRLSVALDEQGVYEAVLPYGKIHVSFDNRELEPHPAPNRAGIAPLSLPAEIRSKLSGSRPSPTPTAPQPSSRYVKVPRKYYTSDSGELDFTVGPGMDQRDFELKSP